MYIYIYIYMYIHTFGDRRMALDRGAGRPRRCVSCTLCYDYLSAPNHRQNKQTYKHSFAYKLKLGAGF